MQLEMQGEQRYLSLPDTARIDYVMVQRVVAALERWPRALDGTEDIGRVLTRALGIVTSDIERVIEGWCGLGLTDFAYALTPGYVREKLRASAAGLVVDAGRVRPIHALNVRIASTISDDRGRRGEGLDITYGFHVCPFGIVLLMWSADGICGLAFVDPDVAGGQRATLDDMVSRWPAARFRLQRSREEAGDLATRIFLPSAAGQEIPVVLIGTPFDLQVWQALLNIPFGELANYTQIANGLGRPDAVRAVGTANGRNPISFVVPCHRALRGDGSLGGYYWGLERKRVMIAWEAGRARIPALPRSGIGGHVAF